jgi:uncharacterized membrane protein
MDKRLKRCALLNGLLPQNISDAKCVTENNVAKIVFEYITDNNMKIYETYDFVVVNEVNSDNVVSDVVNVVNNDKKPRGWHFMKEFVDKSGNVYYKGVEQPELKNTLPSHDY